MLVIKCGGNAAVDCEAVCRDVAQLARSGRPVVLVHGGSAHIDRLAGRLGIPQRIQTAADGVPARHTDQATLEVVTLALAGQVKPQLVAALARHGALAVGLTGLDGGLLRARRKQPQRALLDGKWMVVRDSHAGTVYEVDAGLLTLLLGKGLVPVVSPPALADDGLPVNVNADRVAAAVAGVLGADQLVLLTGAAGVHRDPADEGTVQQVSTVSRSGPPDPHARGGMALKLVAAREALLHGVSRVRVADGRSATPVLAALAGGGTEVVLRDAAAV